MSFAFKIRNWIFQSEKALRGGGGSGLTVTGALGACVVAGVAVSDTAVYNLVMHYLSEDTRG